MDTGIVWLGLLLILPGIGSLILSTSNRYTSLHEELHHWLDGEHDDSVIESAELVTRAVHFRNALISLYLSVLCFVAASLTGAVLDFMDATLDGVVFVIATAGILTLGYAALELIRESRLSLRVIQSHVDRMMSEMTE